MSDSRVIKVVKAQIGFMAVMTAGCVAVYAAQTSGDASAQGIQTLAVAGGLFFAGQTVLAYIQLQLDKKAGN